MDAVETLNRTLFLILNATPATPHWLVVSGILIADYAILLVPAMLVALWLTGADERRALAVRACLAGLLALGVNQLIGLTWYHPRPFASATGHTFLAHVPDSSFPSDHVTLLSAVAFTFLYGGKRGIGLLAVFVDIAVAWARIFVGVHWPLDMIGAAIVAWSTYVVSSPLWRLGGMALTRALIALYRKVLAVPIELRWLRP
ncbi:phosphatase PAP2 family protein [Paraburkholderia sp. J10-1]|uniref:phosphatase PAP2 family protein n=1 Tax=Paraburkholderia sp. J10-1 TaxID=2805430 RepID=UPI002AB732E8|nr:phosphatase PAP2 family protein [Paraburkholderia sp. J10-1]